MGKIGFCDFKQVANGFEPRSNKCAATTDGQIQINDLNGSDFFIALSNRERVNTLSLVLWLANDFLRAAFRTLAGSTGHKGFINKGHAAGHREIEPFATRRAWIENRSHDFATKDIWSTTNFHNAA